MNLTNFNAQLKNGREKTDFLIQSPGFKLYPGKFSYSTDINHTKNSESTLKFLFNIYINYENLYALEFSFNNLFEYPDEEQSFHINCNLSKEPFYEYGNEENNLPAISSIITFYNQTELLNALKLQLEQFEYNHEQNIFNDLFNILLPDLTKALNKDDILQIYIKDD